MDLLRVGGVGLRAAQRLLDRLLGRPAFAGRCGHLYSICWTEYVWQMVFGRYINIRRRHAKLGLRVVAQVLGISANYLYQVEKETRPPFGEDRWPALVEAVPGITWEGLTWAAAADLGVVAIGRLSRQQCFAISELLAQMRDSEDIPENFDAADAQEAFRDRTMLVDAPRIVDGILEVLGDASMSAAQVTDALIALGWRPRATNMEACVRSILAERSDLFVRSGRQYRRRR